MSREQGRYKEGNTAPQRHTTHTSTCDTMCADNMTSTSLKVASLPPRHLISGSIFSVCDIRENVLET